MATTSIPHDNTLLNAEDANVVVKTGHLSTDMNPGSWVVYDHANDQWIPLDTDSSSPASHALIGDGVGVVIYRPRIKPSTGALRLVTDDYDVSESEGKMAEICTSGIVWAKIADQGGTKEPPQDLIATADAEIATVRAAVGTGNTIGTLASKVIDNDTYAIVALGAFKGRLYPHGPNS
jgi:hypothetical protein